MKKFLVLVLAFAAPAFATNPPDPRATATADATAAAGDSISDASVVNTSMTDVDNTNLSSVTQNYQRSAPSLFAPPAFPAIGCGRGVSVGGSSTGGGGIIAFNWNEKDCAAFAKRVSYAQAFAAIEQRELACEILLADPMAADIWPAGKPFCKFPVPGEKASKEPHSPSDKQPPASGTEKCVTPEELRESNARLLERCTAK